MPYVAVAEDNSAPIDLYYEDHGAGPAVVLVHGFASSSRSWEKQVVALYRAGFRVVAYDRRGFGQSSMPAFGYDFNTLAADLHALIGILQLRDVALVGFGMGGGDVARYSGRYGPAGVRRVGFISSITPHLDVPNLSNMQSEIETDRFAFARSFIADTYKVDSSTGPHASIEVLQRDFGLAAAASPIAMSDSISAWREDFRSDLAVIKVPTLVIHGDRDRIAPFATTAQRMPAYLDRPTLTVVEGAPHQLIWTHASTINTALLHFLTA
ncbi:MAG TPA: alpha/beta hydrolase [Candidatus Tumulicola sp.]